MTATRSALLGSLLALLAAGAAVAYALRWLAIDACLDAGGRVAGFACESAAGAESLLVHVPLSLFAAGSVFFFLVLVRGIKAILRAKTGAASPLGR